MERGNGSRAASLSVLTRCGVIHDKSWPYAACGALAACAPHRVVLVRSLRVTSGWMPSARRFPLPLKRHFRRHRLPPAGETSRYKPPPSNRRTGLPAGLAVRIAVSVRGIGGIPDGWNGIVPQSCPHKMPDHNRLAWAAMDRKKAGSSIVTWLSGLLWTTRDNELVVIGGLEPPTPAL